MNLIKEMFDDKAKVYKLNGEVILDISKPIENKSRVPLYESDETKPLIKILEEIEERASEINQGIVYQQIEDIYTVMTVMATDHLIRSADTPKVCEIGCNSGVLSMNLAMLLKELDPISKFVCVTNAIGNESGTGWLDHIACITPPEGLSLVASDFHDTMLKDEGFALTIINGIEKFDDPLGVLEEADRITFSKGKILCFSLNQPLLDDGVKIIFKNVKEFRFNAMTVLYLITK
jgi:hypothetical protein